MGLVDFKPFNLLLYITWYMPTVLPFQFELLLFAVTFA